MIIKAIKIDVEKKEVYAMEIEKGLKGLYKGIGCQRVSCVAFHPENDLWLDDESLYQYPQSPKFIFAGLGGILTGNALICGYDGKGDSTHSTMTVEQVRNRVTFLEDDRPIEDAEIIFVCWEDYENPQGAFCAHTWSSVGVNMEKCLHCQQVRNINFNRVS